jgi:MtrB/PioB family decaheme-associated outer membrane protein
MSTRALATALLVAAVAAPFGTPGTALAQGGALTAAFAVGGRVRVDSLDEHSKGKLEEYRHIPENAPFLQQLRLDYLPVGKNELYHFVLREPGERDQGTWLRGTAPGKWDAQLRWDRITHTFSTTARSLGQESSPGVFTLPTPRPDTASWNRAPYLDATRTRWDPVRAVIGLTPSENWSLKAEYTWIGKTGDRPLGMAMGSPGNNFREILEPIDQTVQSLRLTEGFARRRVQAVLTYEYSRFTNDITSVTADNPLVATSSVAGGPAQGRSALPPSNSAHIVTGTGSLGFPKSTRITGTVSLSWRKQNELFLPPTINPALVVPNLDQFPDRLHGDVRTTLVNVSASSRPVRHLTLAGRFRYFDQSDHTAELVMPAEVVDDRTVNAVAEARDALPFAKTNAEVTGTWKFNVPVSLIAGWTFERWERARLIRNARHTNEHGVRLGVTTNPVDWFQVRGSYIKSWRRVVGDYLALTEDQPDGFRRFDQSDRNRDKLEIQTQLEPTDAVSFGGIFIVGTTDYTDAVFGLQREKNFLAGGDLAWTPVRQLNLGLAYTRETFKGRQRARYREPTQIANVTYDWVSNNDDYIDTFGANATAQVVQNRLEVGGNIELAKSRLVNGAFNPTTPTGGTAAQNASALAANWPDITQKWIPASLFARYRVNDDWAATLQFWYDKFDKSDFRTDGLMPATGADIFLGNDYRNYLANFMTITISYRPRLLRTGGRSAL